MMAYLNIAIWFSLLFHDLQLFGVRGSYCQWITVPPLEDFQTTKELHQFSENFHFGKTKHEIVKRSTDELQIRQTFKFELDDAKEPDEETKKIIQIRGRELQLKVKPAEVVNMTMSKRTKRSTQKLKPVLIPFLITDAKEPDNATKELIRKSRAKEISLIKNKEPPRSSRTKVPSNEPVNQSKIKTSVSQIKESMRQSRVMPVVLNIQNPGPLKQSRIKAVTLSTQSNEPLRKGQVQSVPLTDDDDRDSLRQRKLNEKTSSTQNRQRPAKKSSRKRTRRFAQLTEPRYIKFELHDVKQPDNEIKSEMQLLQQPNFSSDSMNQMFYNQPNETQYDSDSSGGETKYHYIFHQAPKKPYFASYPKHNDLVFRVSKKQKYIATGQGLENINTNIEISIPPTVTATAIVEKLLSEYPQQMYGQKICPYGNPGCQTYSIAPSQQEYSKPIQNLVAENEVLPVQHQQQYHYNTIYSQPQVEVTQQFIPLDKPYEQLQPTVHVPVIEQQPVQDPQVSHNLIDSNPSLKIAFLEPAQSPAYAYGDKLYPYNVAKPAIDQSAIGQEEPQNHNVNNEEIRFNLLKNNQEFQELSALIGKSPTDQVHGLSYLLAKEMQKQKSFKPQPQRPQDQTSPILFHPKDNMSTNMPMEQQQVSQEPKQNQLIPFRQLRQLRKNIPPAVEQNTESSHVNQENQVLRSNDMKAVGLSPNYNGIDSSNYLTPKTYPAVETEPEEDYDDASKYAFGYRVRDFHSGNDFAHKQNRDDDGVTRGQYHILLPDGRIQNVIYYADDTGFHADVSY